MKKALLIAVITALVVGTLASCASKEKNEPVDGTKSAAQETNAPETDSAAEESSTEESAPETTVGISGEETLENDGVVYHWDECDFTLFDINEDTSDFEMPGSTLVSPEGKYVVVVLKITEGEISISALSEKLHDGYLTLNNGEYKTCIAKGIHIDDSTSEDGKKTAMAIGDIYCLFDVDKDISVDELEVFVVED